MDRSPIDDAALLRIAATIAAATTKLVALSGGEPMMVKSLPAIVATLKASGKIVSINTNGHLLEEAAAWVAASGVDHVQVSIDAPDAQLHDAIRQHQGSFDRILRGIAALKAARQGELPRISVCGVLMRENAGRLAEFVDAFTDIADAVEVQPLHENLGLMTTSTAQPFAAVDRAPVAAEIDRTLRRHPAMADAYHRNFERFLFDRGSLQHLATDHCFPRIFNTLTIREDGACFICRYPLDANIHDTDLAAVWRSPARRELYRTLASDGCAEPCWLRCYIHPSPTAGRWMKAALRIL
jgi:MoaA/NifB/PqqE/SkfB family radical SAM enzyme